MGIASNGKIARSFELVVDDGQTEERTKFNSETEGRAAFLKAVKDDPFTASVFSYDRDGNTLARIWHYDTNG